MGTRRNGWRVALAVLAMVAATAAWPSAGIGGTPWTIDETPSPGGALQSHAILATAAVSATDAWAVIAAGCTPTTFLHWDGTTWTSVPGPNPGTCRQLQGMAAASSGDVWAVGYLPNHRGVHRTLVMHWDGEAWTRIPSPNRGTARVENVLHGVTATSATDAWAVGSSWDGHDRRTLTLRWNGTRWSIVGSPSPGSGYPGDELLDVSATSRGNAWAVGVTRGQRGPWRTLILRWNGQRWTRVPSPTPGASPWLVGVSAVSRSRAWAVGTQFVDGDDRTLILRWNGDAWKKVGSPNAGNGTKADWLQDVSATSATDAWAVGWTWSGTARRTLVLHWNGVGWSIMPSPNVPGRWNELRAVAAVSSDAAFAVGSSRETLSGNQVRYDTLGMHCC